MRMIKRLTVIAGAFLLVSLLCGFTDLPEDHWAYEAVNELAQAGTVGGFGDGTFRPNEPVTRAQFVKMLGFKTDQRRTDYISDLRSWHWAYDILMYSPLKTENYEIRPDDNALREEVAVYLYDCYGKNAETKVPSIVTNGAKYTKEISWIYEKGIMVGNDGINLRLKDNLTRAEAAVLIASAKSKLNNEQGLCDAASDAVLESVFNNSGLFDCEYNRDAVITNGEVARAAYRLQKGVISGLTYNFEADFEHEYANDLKAMESVLGEGRISAEFADSTAMPEDAFAMLAYGMYAKLNTPLPYGAVNNYYKDAHLSSKSLNAPLTFNCQNGIYPFGGQKIKTGVAVTHKAIAAVLLQYDMLWGLETSVTVSPEGVTYADEPMRYEGLPENKDCFKGILKNVPNGVYTQPMALVEGTEFIAPQLNYSFFVGMKDAFALALKSLSSEIYEKTNVKIRLTFYPSLIYDTGEGFAIRCKIEGDNCRGIFPSEFEQSGEYWTDIMVPYMFFMAL